MPYPPRTTMRSDIRGCQLKPMRGPTLPHAIGFSAKVLLLFRVMPLGNGPEKFDGNDEAGEGLTVGAKSVRCQLRPKID